MRRAIWNATGISIASAPMFFTKADSTVTVPPRYRDLRPWWSSDTGPMRCKTSSTIPERSTAALTKSAEPTMMTMSSQKPVNALSGRHDAGNYSRQQGQQRDQVEAQAPPHEKPHRYRDNGES